MRLYDVPTETVIKCLQGNKYIDIKINYHIMLGHTSRVFNIAWNPVTTHILASGSDDKTIRIWDTKQVIYF